MKSTLLKSIQFTSFLVAVIIAVTFPLQAYGQAGTLTFTETGHHGNTLTDGAAGSTDIPGITYNIYGVNNVGAKVGDILVLTYTNKLDSHYFFVDDGNSMGLPIDKLVIESGQGETFALKSFNVFDELGEAPDYLITGFRNGMSVATQTQNLSAGVNIKINLNTDFENVDRVEISDQNRNIIESFNTFVFENSTAEVIVPTVVSVDVPANGTYTAGQNLDFTVNTSENITVNTAGGIPRIALTIGETTRYASYLSGSGTSSIMFRYTVQAGDSDDDGIAVATTVESNGGTLRDSAGNDLNTTLNSVGSTEGVLVDAVAPIVSAGFINISGASGDGGTYRIGDTITATWDNTTNGDNNTVTITGVTVDFSEFGGGSEIEAVNDGDIWSASYTITYGSISDDNRNISVSATNDNGTTTTTDNSNASVNNIAFPIGSGTESDPYEIATADQLNYVRDFLDSHFIQTANIDLGVSPWNDDERWEPIEECIDEFDGFCERYEAFTGSYDGQGFEIQNLFINRPSNYNVGLFRFMDGTISNVGLVSVDITGDGRAGAIAGYTEGGNISKSYSTGFVKGGNGVGGLVGYAGWGTSIENSYSTADVEGNNEIGGFVGIMQGDAIQFLLHRIGYG